MSIIANIIVTDTYNDGDKSYGKVYIVLTDSVTGNPVSGGDIIIDYVIGANGVPTNYSQQMFGQSYLIYDGLIYDPTTYMSFFITGQSVDPSPPPPPPAGFCDLVISNIIINQPESGVGADDASVTVNASSTYGAIEYSIDNSTWQTSPTFTGLGGGLLTVYARDTNPVGCLVNQSVTIPVLTNLIASDPGVSVSGGNTSRWNAAFNPIVFKYQRKDFEVTAASLYSTGSVTGTTLAINGDMSIIVALVAANVTAGPANSTPIYIYVNAGPYKGVYTVIDATINSVSIKATYTTTAGGFINSNNIKPYYKIKTQIQLVNNITGEPYVIESLNRPDGTGLVTADISALLQSLLKAKSDSDYTAVNYRDINLSASYRIAYAESYDNGTDVGYTSQYVQLAHTYYVVYAAKQLGDKYGGNLAEYVPFKNKSAKWVTDFETPVYSLSFPFDLGFIYGDDLAGEQVYYKIQPLDINKQPIGGPVISAFLLNENGGYLTNTDGSRLIIAQTTVGNVPIVEHVGLNRLLIDYSFSSDVYYATVSLWYDKPGPVPTQVLNDQLIKVDKQCDYNSVYLRWIGLTGCWNYYRFIYNQEVTLDVQNATIIKNYVFDWENEESIEKVISKSAGEKMQVHAEDMQVDEIKGCQSMKYSPVVQMLVSKSPIKWMTVVLNTATFNERETDKGVYPFAVTFNLPSKNIQNQ